MTGCSKDVLSVNLQDLYALLTLINIVEMLKLVLLGLDP